MRCGDVICQGDRCILSRLAPTTLCLGFRLHRLIQDTPDSVFSQAHKPGLGEGVSWNKQEYAATVEALQA